MEANVKQLLKERAKIGNFLSLWFHNGSFSTGRLGEMDEDSGHLIIEQLEGFWKKKNDGDHVPDFTIIKLIVPIENIHHFAVS